MEPHLRLRGMILRACAACYDTTVALTLLGPLPCSPCVARVRLSFGGTKLAEFVWRRTKGEQVGKPIDSDTLEVARILVHATSDFPFTGPVLRAHLGINERDLKQFVETIRSDWRLPLISRREKGGGYWYAETAQQFNDWFRTMRGQAIRELSTAYGMQRANYPELAGQDSLEFIRTFTQELQEGLR